MLRGRSIEVEWEPGWQCWSVYTAWLLRQLERLDRLPFRVAWCYSTINPLCTWVWVKEHDDA